MLSTLRERHAARRWARLTGGRAAGQAMEDYQLAATELALVHLRLQRGIIARSTSGSAAVTCSG